MLTVFGIFLCFSVGFLGFLRAFFIIFEPIFIVFCEVLKPIFLFVFSLFGRSLTVGLLRYKRGTRAFRSDSAESESLRDYQSLTQGEGVEIVATISSFYLILLSVAIEVFFSANVQSLANFTSLYAVFFLSVLQQSLTQILPICNIVLRFTSLGFFLRLFF